MKTKSFLLTMLLLLAGTQVVAAQHHHNGRHANNCAPRECNHDFQEAQCDMIIRELALDDATTERFRTVYNQYLQELQSTYNPKLDNIKCPYCGRENCDGTDCPGPKGEKNATYKRVGKKLPTDAEVEARIKARFAQSRKILDIREKYYKEYRKFLSPKQIQRIYTVEKRCKNRIKRHSNNRNYTTMSAYRKYQQIQNNR